MTDLSRREHSSYWKPVDMDGVELLRASYITQNFRRHTHEGYGFGVIERGALEFFYFGENVVAPAGAINLVIPGEPHDGHAAVRDGWNYRMFYVDAEVVRKAARQVDQRSAHLPFFNSGVIQDPDLARNLLRLHQALEEQRETVLELETRFLMALVRLIVWHASDRYTMKSVGRERKAVRDIREFIQSNHSRNIATRQLSELTGMSPFHLVRVFQREVGLPPHAYLNQIRIHRAKSMLARGESIVDTALETGFTDQSHLTRHFKRIVGLTPGVYRRSVARTSRLERLHAKP